MKLFLDANILVSVLNKEYPLFTYSSRIVSLADRKNYQLFTTPVCLAIAFYFAEKKDGRTVAKRKIKILAAKLSVAGVGENEVTKSLENNMIHDFEDGMQYYAAENNHCEVIITEDLHDFYFSSLEVSGCKNFIEKYLF